MNALEVFRDRLLRETVAWCIDHSSFYRDRFGVVGTEFSGLEDLERLPILFREDAANNTDAMLCSSGPPACVQYTTGTTGTFFQLYRSQAEVSDIGRFFSHLIATNDGLEQDRPLCLALASAYHGTPTPVPTRAYILSAGVYDRTQASQARRILEHSYRFPNVERRVSMLVGGDILIKALTGYLMADGFDFTNSGIRTIIMTGGHMSAARKHLLARTWNARVIDRYSMSEIFGGAVECEIGGAWTFDAEVIPEVVHPRTLRAMRTGIGVLVLTGLYPFVQMMPMIRYYTGDLVEIVDSPETGAPDLLVRFVGRERRSILDVTGEGITPLLLAAPLNEIIEAIPDVAASGRFADLCAGSNLEFAGKLHYSLSSVSEAEGGLSITLTLGLRYAPWMYPARVTELVSALRAQLYERFPELRRRVLSRQITLRVVTTTGEKVPPFNAK
jgi:phenylacetate-coenzyme A ligase PaaK-like adenylate-forming protein